MAVVEAGRGLLGLATCLLFHRLAEAVTFAVHLEYLAVMRQTIQERRRHPLALKNLPPVAEGKVACEQQALPLVAVGEDLHSAVAGRREESWTATPRTRELRVVPQNDQSLGLNVFDPTAGERRTLGLSNWSGLVD